MRAEQTTYTPVTTSSVCTALHSSVQPAGIQLRCPTERALQDSTQAFLSQLETLELRHCVELPASSSSPLGFKQSFQLRPDLARIWAPGLDTTGLQLHLERGAAQPESDLAREIVSALLLSPLTFDFRSHAELAAAVRMRRNIVVAAHQTALAFGTLEADRPEDCWTYVQVKGFVVKPGCALIAALVKATQPEISGQLYSFSCYRATEYVILLAIAQELERSNTELLARLQQQWQQRPIMSGQFHDVFLHEYGSMQAPLPPKYYVPGDLETRPVFHADRLMRGGFSLAPCHIHRQRGRVTHRRNHRRKARRTHAGRCDADGRGDAPDASPARPQRRV